MLKLLKWAILVAGLAAVAAFVPIHGRTAVDRWHKAGTAGAFFQDTWSEIRQSWASTPGKPAPHPASAARHPAHPHAPSQHPAPVENHSSADRTAVDRLVADRLNQK